MAYLGQTAHETAFTNRVTNTMTGDGSDTTLTLSSAPISVNNVIVFIDGVMQRPTTDYTVSGTTLTFAVAPHNSANVQAIIGGGEHIGIPLAPITEEQLVDGVVTSAKLESGIQIPADKITSLAASKITGALPALAGGNLTGMSPSGVGIDNVTTNPSPTTNPSGGVGTIHLNKTTGEMFVCTNATANNNIWFNVGEGSGDISNAAPTNPTSTNNFPDIAISSSQTFTFSGATDTAPGSVTHYKVDTISSANLTVSAAEVAAGSAHTFVTNGNITSNVTFRVRAKDNQGAYSSGVTVTMNIVNPIVAASGGNSSGTDGDYQYRIFTSNGTLNVTTAAADITYLVVGGGGAGGAGPGGGGGGGGGYKTGTFTPTVSNYTITVGQGGTSHPATPYNGPMGASEKGKDSVLSGTGASITAEGGGYGGGCLSASTGGHAYNQPGGNGGSGGGGSWGYNGSKAGGTASAGNAGGDSGAQSNTDWCWGGGGGGASTIGFSSNTNVGGDGGDGISNSIGGSNPHGNGNNYFSSGGGGGGDSYRSDGGWPRTNGGYGGRGSPYTAATHGVANTGAGGGGAPNNHQNSISGAGGSGIVIVRYKYQ